MLPSFITTVQCHMQFVDWCASANISYSAEKERERVTLWLMISNSCEIRVILDWYVYLFVGCLMMLSVVQTIWHWMVGLMNWKGCGRKQSWPPLRYYHEIRLGGLRKVTRNLSQDCRCPNWDSNRNPPKSKSEVLLPQPACSVNWYETKLNSFYSVWYKLWIPNLIKAH
jgi:hypothetical protein